MSKIDPEVLYLILTKVAGQEPFYNYDPKKLPSGQMMGTITHRQLGEVYERITGNRMGVRTNWNLPLEQLNQLLAKCSLPSLSPLLLTSAEASASEGAEVSKGIEQARAANWPPFSALKNLFRRG